MANKKENIKNRIPVHFVDDDSGDPPAERDDGDRDAEPRLDEKVGGLEVTEVTPDSEDDTEGEGSEDRASAQADNKPDEDDEVGGAALKLEGQDFEASIPAPPASDASPLRSTADTAATGPVLAELIATRAELRRVESELAELREALARRQADFENYRKRVERERSESYNRMVGEVVSKLLPVLDNLRRALEAEGSLQANESEEFRHFLHGVELIYKQLSGVLEGLGLQLVPALGHRFDPHVHEAVVTEQTEEYEPDTVIQELVPGYRLGEKLIRPAIVKVATR